MKKLMYSVNEIRELVLELEKDKDSFLQEDINVTKNSLSIFVLYEGNIDGHPFEAFQGIASDAYILEQRAKQLRNIVRAFKCPVKDLPTLMNDENSMISAIARWRLKLGR
jgi:hypothetical protein